MNNILNSMSISFTRAFIKYVAPTGLSEQLSKNTKGYTNVFRLFNKLWYLDFALQFP